jgi:hypothetical protein
VVRPRPRVGRTIYFDVPAGRNSSRPELKDEPERDFSRARSIATYRIGMGAVRRAAWPTDRISRSPRELRDKEQQLRAARADQEKEWTEAAADRRSLLQEFGWPNDELDRLRAVLREHGIERGGDGT